MGVEEGAALQVDSANNIGRAVVDYPRGDAPPTLVFNLDENVVVERVRNNLIPMVVQNSDTGALTDDLRVLLRRDDVQQSLLVPLVVGGLVIGILRLDKIDPEGNFSDEQIGLAQTIASQAGIAVQNAALFEQSSIRTSELETLFESAQATAVTLDLGEVVRRVTVQMLSALGTDACTIFLWDDVSGTLTVRGEVSARAASDTVQVGDIVELDEYPLRRRALQDRELITIQATDDDLPPGERALIDKHEAATRVLIPLIVNEISIGLVEVESLDPTRQFRPEAMRLAQTLASQAAISIENARLQTETRRTVEELYVINDMSTALSAANSMEELLDVIDMQLPNLTEAQWLYVVLYDAATGQLTFPLALSVLTDERQEMAARPLGNDEFSLIVRNRAPLLLAGTNIDDVRRSLGIETVMQESRCFLGVPLYVGDEVIGVLGVRDDQKPAAFTHNDQRILTTIGGQLGVALHGTRLFQQTVELAEALDRRVQERTTELEQERQHISTLYNITTELAVSLDMERLLDRALTMTARAVGATQGAILAVEPITERLYFRARLGWDVPAEGESEDLSLAMNEGLGGWAIQQRRSVVIEDVQNDPRWLRLSEADDQPRSAMVALIETNEDILGVMMLYSETPGKFAAEQLRLVTAAASQVANAMNNAELYSLIRDQAERLGEMLRHEQVEATQSASVLNAIADGVMVVNAEGRVIVFNTAATRILGVATDQVLHRSTAEISGLYGGSSQWTEKVEQWMEDPTAYEPGEFHEERLRLEDGRVINVRLSPVNMGDQFLGMVSIFRDITREVEVDRLKSDFVATVSHELRTPMTSIKGYADLLLLGAAGAVSDQQQRFLETIKQNADRLSILVNDLLDISRIDQGRMDLKPTMVEVPDLVNSVVLHLRGRCEDEGRTLLIEGALPEDEHLTIWGDYDKVAQIMTNLADNSFNYTPEEGKIAIAARYDDATEHVILSISDTGIGIPPEVADRVFERFFRGDEAQDLVMDTPGTGLGLAIVNELVLAHGGKIWFESEVNQGTTFFVSLPTKPWAEPEDEDAAE
ncbi:MAG: GAF domain-containing protein [Anaerolineae bacterium]|nr:GAF domain-containing protein [Anaerolineae bacterium]